MKKLIPLAVALTGLLFTSSCTKDSTADGSLRYSFQATSLSSTISTTGTASGIVTTPLANGSINWTSTSANISKIEFSAKKSGAAISLETKNLNGINAFKPDSVLSGTVGLVSGVYENIQLKLSLLQSTSTPPFTLNGTYVEASGTKIPVIVQLNQTQDITLSADRIEVAATKYVATVKLELNNLVKGLVANDFGQTTRTGSNNTIVVNSTTNTALYNKLVANLAPTASVTFTKQ